MRSGADLRPTQPELAQVGEWRHAHVAVEVLGEGALIAEAEIAGDVGNVRPFALQRLACGLVAAS